MNVAIAGASGVVGSRVLHDLLARGDVGRVLAVGRRVLPATHEKLDSVVADFAHPPSVTLALPDVVSVAFCCLGTTMRRAGSREAFRAVDHYAVLAFAEAARLRGAERFVVVSSIGADPGARSFYLRTKGQTEEALAGVGFRRLIVVRPSLLDDEGARDEFRIAERFTLILARLAFRVLGRTRRYAPIRADTVARAMVQLGLEEGEDGVRIVESDRLHEIAGAGS